MITGPPPKFHETWDILMPFPCGPHQTARRPRSTTSGAATRLGCLFDEYQQFA
jgi:hypothetical protein